VRIYLDTCCYNRPMDNLSQDKIYMESEAIKAILSKCEYGVWDLVGSEVLEFELKNNPNTVKQQKTLMLYSCAKDIQILTDHIIIRAKEFENQKIKALDALHLATAEYANVNTLLSVDSDFIKLSKMTNTKISVRNPVDWLMEVDIDD